MFQANCLTADLKVCLPTSVLEHIEPSECVFKLSSSVKTSRGVGKIAMTQRRLFLLTDGRPGYVEVAQYRELEVRTERFGKCSQSESLEHKIALFGYSLPSATNFLKLLFSEVINS